MNDITITVTPMGWITIAGILLSFFAMGYAFAKGWSKEKKSFNEFLNKPHAEG